MQKPPERKTPRQHIRERADRMWRDDGAPKGRKAEYLERARELQAIEDHPSAGLLPNPAASHPGEVPPAEPVEEAALMENLGEFPGFQTDQGDRSPVPMTRDKARRLLRGT
ncbi:MAG TPA: DUF2934 domain-containing protein [Rhodopila sp.]|nr:DUF2934 domain-containing protein [Rhodopila sp.]